MLEAHVYFGLGASRTAKTRQFDQSCAYARLEQTRGHEAWTRMLRLVSVANLLSGKRKNTYGDDPAYQ